ncbi:MAG TPA: hypothetical protein VFW98_06090 [Gemmatimonadaceae bacterium]|nr:hypothetical protein [Gemmatimonadaceae bacterium]
MNTVATALQPMTQSEPLGDVAPDISVVVTVSERPESLAALYEECAATLRGLGRSFEFIVVAHPYFTALLSPLRGLIEQGEPIQIMQTGRAVGETALLRMALGRCRAPVVLTLPAYRQVAIAEVGTLLERIERGADFVVACRSPRHDALVNRLQSRVLRFIIDPLTQGRIHDVACGVRAIRREVLEQLPLYGDFARFLPLLALHNGYVVEEAPCRQHPSNLRGRVYGPGIYLRRLIDVLGLFFLLRFTEKPLRFFGLIGSVFAFAGGVILLWLLAERIGGEGIGGRPLLILSVLLFILGIQSIALGLIGEMIVHFNAARGRSYRIKSAPSSSITRE